MRLSENTIQSVKEVSLVDIIGLYTKLKRSGKEYQGLCPFHNEKSPSFFVHPQKGFKCFGCEAKGFNAIDFIMKLENKTFPEAVIEVATISGIAIEQGNNKRWRKEIKKKKSIAAPQPKLSSSFSVDIFKKSLQDYDTNNFIKYLIQLFGNEITQRLISEYFIGTSTHWNGATVFWQIDISGKIRAGKIMLYSANNGKRIKEPFNHVSWMHSALGMQGFELGQCLFGEHLLNGNVKPVAIVESEKTAIIASIYFPKFIWLAAGGEGGLKLEKCIVLKGRIVILFPDLNKFGLWTEEAKKISSITHFSISDLLEEKANDMERELGLDLADYLIRFDYREFILSEPKAPATSNVLTKKIEVNLKEKNQILTDPKIVKLPTFQPPSNEIKFKRIEETSLFDKQRKITAIDWEQDVIELEKYFRTVVLPVQPIRLNQCSTIINVPLFIESHLATLKASNGKRTFLPFLTRLQELKQYLNSKPTA